MKNLGNITEIIKLCETHQVASLYVFGSVLSEKFNAESDIDFLVNFKEINLSDYADNYFNLKFSLEDLLKRNVDLLEEKALKNPYFIESINQQKELVYG
ncbi:MAG TPA: nucleotidyltransferase domain-containing protein [Kaistella sp.]|nr:nucleotidyltransferase domain-containing protein [Kaistella sp.]HPZ25479.1 nucleotidyltransferase domain-containing protein [Kaistella sp.]HQD44778.1 nucleotidyltransferase domain-containing protein [Kaistella sp.]